MKGAAIWHNLIRKAYSNKIGDLKNIDCKGYGNGYKYKNIIFVLSEHARGKTLKIWIYENENIIDPLKEDNLEVYGVISGQPGWTESYGWIIEGSWVSFIENYMNRLEYEITAATIRGVKAKTERENEEKLQRENKVKAFDDIFKETMNI